MTNEFAGKTVLVTGAGSGIGQGIALAFAKEGSKLVLADINEGGNAETLSLVKDLGAEGISVACDVSEEDQVKSLVDEAVKTFGSLDIAINNAGVEQTPAPLIAQDVESFQRVMDVNVKGVWLCMKHELGPMLQQQRGCIINTSSVSDSMGPPFMQTYAASKHAVLGLTKSVAGEVISSGVRINAVAPGGVLTNMLREFDKQNPGAIEGSSKAHPIGRLADPKDIADAVLLLASDRSRFIVGQSVKVDGGYTLTHGMSTYTGLGGAAMPFENG